MNCSGLAESNYQFLKSKEKLNNRPHITPNFGVRFSPVHFSLPSPGTVIISLG
jgi:hypothetical protein